MTRRIIQESNTPGRQTPPVIILLLPILVLSIMIPSLVKGTTFNSPDCTDGLLAGTTPWATDELLGNLSGIEYRLTWDADYLYAAWKGVDLAEADVYIAFDTLPAEGVTSEYGGIEFTASSNSSDTALPDFAIWFKAGLNAGHLIYQPHMADNTDWDTVQDLSDNAEFAHYGGYSGNDNISELRIPRSYIVLTNTSQPFRIWMWATLDSDSSVISVYPSENTGARPLAAGDGKSFTSSGTGISPGNAQPQSGTGSIRVYDPIPIPTRSTASIEVNANKSCTAHLSYGIGSIMTHELWSNVSGATHTFNLTDLTGTTTYNYSVEVIADDSTNTTGPLQFTTTGNNAPLVSDVKAAFNGTSGKIEFSLSLRDTDGDNPGSVRVTVTDGASFNETFDLAQSGSTGSTIQFTGSLQVESGKSYTYFITATDDQIPAGTRTVQGVSPVSTSVDTGTEEKGYCMLVITTFLIPVALVIGAGVLLDVFKEKRQRKKDIEQALAMAAQGGQGH